jgi:hypothetical protein
MSVSINLIRDLNCGASNTDDIVTICRKGDSLRVNYKDRQNGSSSKQRLLLGKNDLSRYIQNLGHLFLADKQPFVQAQFNFPGFPSFLVDQKSLQNTDTQDALMEIADLVSASWFLDEGEEYDDMPPLVRERPELPRYSLNTNPYSGHY